MNELKLTVSVNDCDVNDVMNKLRGAFKGGNKMNASKITVPANVATAIAHYVNLADTKHEAFADILRLGYEAERSEIILRHFDGDYDLLMEALICGYRVEATPEEKVLEYFVNLQGCEPDEYTQGTLDGILHTLKLLGVQIAGVTD